MKLSLRALKKFVDFEMGARELAEIFSHLGFPCDGIEERGEGIDEILIGKILEKTSHPDADRLSLLKVDLGKEVRPIVCGAQNMKTGDLVALAPVGSCIPGADGKGLKLKQAKIRGQISEGMCCSEVELGISDESDGILILPPELEKFLGDPLVQHLPLKDQVLDLDVTPNRGDALSVKGLARELAAKLGKKMITQDKYRFKHPSSHIEPSIESYEDAYGFAACLVKGVKVQPVSFEWKGFLEKLGARTKFNLVDVTNIVLFEQGHPIHFFDAEKVDPMTIGVRRAKQGEKLELLNGQCIDLHPEDLVIADAKNVLSLAGVMGGAASACSESTKNILIEVASFNPRLIRATAKRHQISSESSFRFERGVTPYRIDDVMERALGLLQELSGFESAEANKVLAPKLIPASCLWNRRQVEGKLGNLKLSDDEIFELLRRLEYEFENRSGTLQVIFPWYRTDCEILEDVMEDIGRLVGYENLEPKPLVAIESVTSVRDLKKERALGHQLLERAVAVGFFENVNSSFADPDWEAKFGFSIENAVKVLNPIQSNKSVLRQSLIPSLLERAIMNASHYENDIRICEFGPVFSKNGPSDYQNSPTTENWRFAAVYCFRQMDQKKMWMSQIDPYFDFKSRIQSILAAYDLRNSTDLLSQLKNCFHPKRLKNLESGIAGEIHPAVLNQIGYSGRIFAFETSMNLEKKSLQFQSASAFPPLDLDLSLEMASEIKLADVLDSVRQAKLKDLVSIRAYDLYESKELKERSRKAVTFALRYQNSTLTLQLEDVQKRQEKLIKSLQERFSPEKIAMR